MFVIWGWGHGTCIACATCGKNYKKKKKNTCNLCSVYKHTGLKREVWYSCLVKLRFSFSNILRIIKLLIEALTCLRARTSNIPVQTGAFMLIVNAHLQMYVITDVVVLQVQRIYVNREQLGFWVDEPARICRLIYDKRSEKESHHAPF